MNTKHLILPLAASIATLLVQRAQAQIPWLASPANNNWNNTANWTGANIPDLNTEQAVFDASSITAVSVTAATTVQKITFNATAPAYSFSGSALTIDVNTASTVPDAILVTAGAGAVTIGNAITLNDSNATGGNVAPTINAGGGTTLTLNGTVSTTGNRNLPFQGDGVVNVNGLMVAGTGQIQQSGNVTLNIFTNPTSTGQIRSFSNGGGIRIATSLNKPLGTGVAGGNTHLGRIFLVSDGVVSSGALSTPAGTGTGTNMMDVTFGTDIIGTGSATHSAGFVFNNLSGVLTGSTATIRLDVGTDDTLNMTGAITGAAGGYTTPLFRKQGLGTAVLTGANTYTIPTQIAQGTLIVTPSQAGNSALSVDDGATLGVRLITAGTTLNTSSLTLGSAAGSTLNLDTRTLGNPTVAPVTAGAFTTNGTSTINLLGSALATGTAIPLIDYAGAIGGAGFGGLTVTLPFRIGGTLVDNAVDTRVDIDIVSEAPKWNGNLPGGVWDIDDGTNTVGTLNWKTSATSTTTGYVQAPIGVDTVIFDDSATGTTTVALNTTVSPTGVNVANPTKTYTLTGAGKISGATGLVKSGAGILILANTAANDYSGASQINDGVVRIGDGVTAGAGSLGAGAAVIAAPASLIIDRPDNVTIANAISGAGSLSKLGTNNVTLTGALTFSGATSLGAGTLTLNSGAAYTLPSAITGGGALVKLGTAIVTLTGDNAATHTGSTTITAGQLQFGNGAVGNPVGGNGLSGSPGTGAISVGTGATLRLARNDGSLIVPNTISGAGGVAVSGAFGSIVELSGANTFTGGVAIDGGSLRIRQAANLGAGTKTITVNNGTNGQPGLRLDGSGGNITLPPTFSFNSSSANATNAAIINEAGDNTIGGQFTMTTGGGSTRIRVDAGTLRLAGNVTTNATGRFLILDGAANGTLAGIFNDGNQTGANVPGLQKEGSGTWTLTGANSYTGTTTVNGGALITTAAHIGATAITVNNGATFGVRKTNPAATFTTPGINLGNATFGTIRLDGGGVGAPTAAFIDAATFSVGSGSTIELRGAAGYTAGAFTAVDYAGAIGGAGFAGLTLALPNRVSGTLVDNAGNTSVDIDITAVNFPRWNGNLGSIWDTDTGGATGTNNWKELTSGNTTQYRQNAPDTDSVIFNDSAAGTTTVSLSTTLTPDSVLVDNSLLAYSFTGAGKISGSTGILKTNAGALTITNTGTNDYTGVTTIAGGTIVIGDGTTNGAGSVGTGGIANAASLILNRPDDFTIAGSVTGNGTLTKSKTNTATLTGAVTINGAIDILEGTLRFTGGGNLSGVIAGDGNLTVAGGTLELNGGSNNTFSGVTTVNSGTLRLNKSAAFAIGGDLVINGASVVTQVQNDQFADASIITHNGSVNFDPVVAVSDTVASVIVNTTANAQFIVRGTWNITDTATVNAGLFSIGSGATANIGGVQMTGGTFRIAANTAPTTASIGAGGFSASGGIIEVGQGTGAFDAVLSLGGTFSASANLSVNRGGFTGPNLREINLGGASRTFDITGGTTTILPDIQNGEILKTGAGTLTLNGVQGYTALTANAGTTNINADALNATVTANAAVNFSVNQTLTALIIGEGGVVTLGTPGPAPAPEFADFGADAFESLGQANATQAVPEPGSLALLLGGIVSVLGFRRRR